MNAMRTMQSGFTGSNFWTTMHHRAHCILAISLFCVASVLARDAHPRYLDPSLAPQVRAADLVSRMTLEEKASQMVNMSRAIPRLGVPAYNWWSEALHGVVSGGITEFPEPIGLAATFDPTAIHDMARVIGSEARIKHAEVVNKQAGASGMLQGLDFWAPNVNIFRDPRWGRGQETYGEDPFLSARMGVAYVEGLQGDDPHHYLAISTPKHFAVHSGPEPSRHRDNVDVSKHDAMDTYLPAFRAAVTEGKAASVMCAYNRINGQPACANQFLLEDQLRGKWEFKGYVVSDCDAVKDIWEHHHFAKTRAEGAAIAVERGMDNECNIDHVYEQYADAVRQGYLQESELNRALVRLFVARIELGMFDPLGRDPYSKIEPGQLNSPANRALALKLADESMVLLKNDGVLPIARQGRKILVVGPLAAQTRWLLGNYNGHPDRVVSILEGMKAQFGEQNVTYSPGTTYLERSTVPVAADALRSKEQNGVRVTYKFEPPDGNGKAVVIDGGVVPTVSYDTLPGLNGQSNGKLVSVTWRGKLAVSESGFYNLGIESQGRGEVRLNGKHCAGTPAWDRTLGHLGRVYLEAGNPLDLEVEYDLPATGKTHAELVWVETEPQRLSQAIAAVRSADVVVAVVGITSELEGEEMQVDEPGFKGGDRTEIDLPEPEQDLVAALAAAGKPLVLVLTNGSALAINKESKLANAVLDSFYAGEAGGTAVAQTLSGENNPAGRLPLTFYTGVAQLPPFSDYSMKGRTYRYFAGTPLYPFGYGLSYTTFKYEGLKLNRETLHAGDSLSAAVSVTNSGNLAGDEVAELYLKFPAVDGAPLLALRGFVRVHLVPGEARRVTFKLSPRDLSMVTAAGEPIVAEGRYDLFIGGAQPADAKAGLHSDFRIRGMMRLPE